MYILKKLATNEYEHKTFASELRDGQQSATYIEHISNSLYFDPVVNQQSINFNSIRIVS